jgi:phosphoribosylaminoimidazole carboxylase (NCAIR synthetase)
MTTAARHPETVRMGYDGKGQVRETRADASRVRTMGKVTCLLEKMLPPMKSVLTARGRWRIGGLSDRRKRPPRRHPVHHHRAGPNVSDARRKAQKAAQAIVAERLCGRAVSSSC